MLGTVELEVFIRQNETVNVHVCDIMQALNELPLPERWNSVAQLINQVELEDHDDKLKPEEREVILKWLDARMKSFNK